MQGSLFGLCGSLPPVYTNAIMAGSAAAGVFMNGLMMITKALLKVNQLVHPAHAQLIHSSCTQLVLSIMAHVRCLQHFYSGHSDESTNRIEVT